MLQTRKMEVFQKLRYLRYVNVASDRQQVGSHFAKDGSFFAESGLMASKLQMAENQESPGI